MLCRSSGKPVVVLAGFLEKVSNLKMSEHFGISRRRVRLATLDECIRVFGYRPGCFGPIGHRSNIPVLIRSVMSTRARVVA